MGFDSNTRYRTNVFDIILFFASEEGLKSIPNSQKEILLETAAAVAEYLGSDVTKIPEPKHIIINDNWWITLNRIIKEACEQNSKHLNSALVQALLELLEVKWENDHSESWWESNIRWYLTYEQTAVGRTFYLTVPKTQRVRENIEKFMDPDTIKHCKQIGILMRKYIERDLIAN